MNQSVAGLSSSSRRDFKERVAPAATAAEEHANAVDSEARFPAEAFAAARREGLLGMLVPAELGGLGASYSDVVDTCYMLGRSCASTAMIFAMHQIMVAILLRHGRGSIWHERLLRRIADEQLLMASSTTEGHGGGNLRQSGCAVERDGLRMSLAKSATVVSYGAQADGLLVTARRSPDAAPSDQVLVAFLKDDYQLEAIVGWDALGMRGTCSSGYMLRGSGQIDQVLPIPYPQIHTRTMVPFAHLTWSAVWSGLAAGSVNRARLFFRDVARKSGGQLPPGAAHLTRAILSLRTLRGMVGSAILRYEAIGNKMEELDSLEFQTNINLLKVSASELATATVISSMQACGLTGYRNDTKFSVGRHLRDVLSASVMINNDRILANASEATMMMEVPLTIRD